MELRGREREGQCGRLCKASPSPPSTDAHPHFTGEAEPAPVMSGPPPPPHVPKSCFPACTTLASLQGAAWHRAGRQPPPAAQGKPSPEPRAPSPWLSADKQTLKTPFANNAQNRTEQNRTGQTGSEDVRRGRGRAGGRHGLWVTEVTPRRRPSASSHLRPGPGGRRPLRAAEPADVTGAEGQVCPEPAPPPALPARPPPPSSCFRGMCTCYSRRGLGVSWEPF